MEGYTIGLAIGLGAGMVIGIAIGRKQKPWSELTATEKRNRIIAIAICSILVVIGLVFFLVRLLS
jgi:hypothetical protein